MIWRCGRYNFDTRMPIIMGILNVTPDSFSDGGTHNTYEAALAHAHTMIDEGALIIDVGGESTRPNADPVSVEEECARVLPVIEALAREGVCVSVDTRHAEVARRSVEAGAAIINDVSGFRDPEMVQVATSCDAGLVVMHMAGDPTTMQTLTDYTDVVAEVHDYLAAQAHMLEDVGVDPARICIDPGPGFGKTAHQTLELMRNIHEFVRLGYPVMAAPSRKSYIAAAYKLEGAPATRDEASATEALLASELGASVLRMHNVSATAERLRDLRPYALIALGCNVALVADPGKENEGKKAQLEKAISDMCLMPDTQLIDVSSAYVSEPAYKEDQDEFVNMVALIRTGLAPRDLLKYLHAIEDSLGRVRTEKNGPRTCDLDILDYQGYTSSDEELTLPHPLMLERGFVVEPLLEILPHHVLSTGEEVTREFVRVGKAVRM